MDKSSLIHDIIIVGSGPSAIGLLYGLLSPYDGMNCKSNKQKIPNYSIAVIERGPCSFSKKSKETMDDPTKWFLASHYDLELSQRIDSVPQTAAKRQRFPIPTGTGLGGGSNINACLAVRPSLDDFDSWPEQWKKNTITTISQDEREIHEDENNLNSKQSLVLPKIMASVIEIEKCLLSNKSLISHPHDKDFQVVKSDCNKLWNKQNNDQDVTPLFTPCNIMDSDTDDKSMDNLCIQTMRFVAKKNGDSYERVNYYEGILEPLLQRNPHLREMITFYTNTQVERLILQPKSDNNEDASQDAWVIKGVQCKTTLNGQISNRNILANKKVILCTGAIYTPAILMVSGIGNKEVLESAGVTPLCLNDNHRCWDGVGRNLRDHTVLIRMHSCTNNYFFPGKSVNQIRGYIGADISKTENDGLKSRVMFMIMDGIGSQWMVPMAITRNLKRSVKLENKILSLLVDHLFEFLFKVCETILDGIMKISYIVKFLNQTSAGILVGFLDPYSKGSISIEKRLNRDESTSTLSQFNILVDPAYLSDKRDIEQIEIAWNLLDKLAPQIYPNTSELLPGNNYPDIETFAKDKISPYYHWSGSCSMEIVNKSNQNIDHDKVEDIRPNFVVDQNLKVRKIESLHICDASIIPTNISCNPSLTLAAIGFTAASFMNIDKFASEDIPKKMV